MVEKRYQIHIATCLNDVVAERLKIENVLLNFGVFPWGFSEKRTSLNTSRARKQIDDCDYAIFIVSNCYGDLSASGISYLHLDFIYALNKGKTILSFVDLDAHLQPEYNSESHSQSGSKLEGFKQLLKRESTYYHAYNHTNLLELERNVKLLFSQAVREKPGVGWVRPTSTINTSQNGSTVEQLQHKIEMLEHEIARLQPFTGNDFDFSDSIEGSDQESVLINYRTHAYQDGNFKDLHPTRELTWAQVLRVLAPHFHRPTLESTFMRALNEYLETTGLEIARQYLPRAHAVDRTHIDPRSLQQVKLQMKWNNWIVPQSNTSGGSRVYWALTSEGQKQALVATM